MVLAAVEFAVIEIIAVACINLAEVYSRVEHVETDLATLIADTVFQCIEIDGLIGPKALDIIDEELGICMLAFDGYDKLQMEIGALAKSGLDNIQLTVCDLVIADIVFAPIFHWA